ncbi:MAG TPA: hypothetical protein VJW51_05160 [Candidatus Acidoferrales bacterium]|nr:hypothetical protein [Candidatus Acidoferrales bacterium]
MVEETRNWFRTRWFEFKNKHSRSPEKAEWAIIARQMAQSPEDPFPDHGGITDDLIVEAFQVLDIRDARAEEMLRKLRDACTNSFRRKYVSGTF